MLTMLLVSVGMVPTAGQTARISYPELRPTLAYPQHLLGLRVTSLELAVQ